MALTKVTYSMIDGASVNVLDFGADPTGGDDSSTAIQAALDYAIANSPCSIWFGNGTYKVDTTITTDAINDISLLGDGALLVGSSAAILDFGDYAGALNYRVNIKGITVTNNATTSLSTADAINLRNMRECDIDITAYDVGGAALRFGGDKTTSVGSGAWSTIKIRAFDVGYGFFGEIITTNKVDVVVRRARKAGVHLWDCAQLSLNATIDEVLQPSVPGGNDGVGVLAIDVNWSTLIGSVGLCKREALKMLGNCQWNTITGEWYDSGTQTDATYANISLNNNGGATTPKHNIFNVYAGYTASGSVNKPTYGINQLDGSENFVTYCDATGCASGGVTGISNYTRNFSGNILHRFSADQLHTAQFDRTTNDGEIVRFSKDNTQIGGIYSRSGSYTTYTFQTGAGGTGVTGSSSAIIPTTGAGAISDNAISWGNGSARWSVIYAGTGTINTSDRNDKTEIVDISNVEKRVAVKLKTSMKRFKFKDGERYHFGTIAQDVKAAFESEGLVVEEYGVFCSDVVEDGSVRLGVRYDELFAFIISAL